MNLLSFKTTVATVFICSVCIPQLSYGSELNYSADTSYFTPTSGQITDSHINVSNQGNDSVDVRWVVLNNTLNSDWQQRFCDFSKCDTNEFDSLPSTRTGTLEPGYSEDWTLGIDLKGEPLVESVWEIEVEVLGTGEKDTLTWIVREEPASNNYTSMTYSNDTAYIKPEDGKIVNGYIAINNSGFESVNVDIEWRLINSTLDDDMVLQFCDFYECATNEFSPLPDSRAGTLEAGYSDDWYIGVDPNGQEVEDAVWRIEVDYLNYDNQDTLTWIVTMNPPVSTNSEVKTNWGFSLYPNPATSQLNVKRNASQNARYRILDMTGKELSNGNLNAANEQIDVSRLSRGIYFLEVQNNEDKKLSKFVKQ